MTLFSKHKIKSNRSETEYGLESLQELGISDCFYTIPFGMYGRKRTEEEIQTERIKTIEKCKKILKEYEERNAAEELAGKRKV